jgi:hypothetical protein
VTCLAKTFPDLRHRICASGACPPSPPLTARDRFGIVASEDSCVHLLRDSRECVRQLRIMASNRGFRSTMRRTHASAKPKFPFHGARAGATRSFTELPKRDKGIQGFAPVGCKRPDSRVNHQHGFGDEENSRRMSRERPRRSNGVVGPWQALSISCSFPWPSMAYGEIGNWIGLIRARDKLGPGGPDRGNQCAAVETAAVTRPPNWLR